MRIVNDIVSREVLCAAPGETVASAASLMREHGASVIAVEDDGKLVGVLTTGDIAIRAIVLTRSTPIRDVMDEAAERCYADESADAVAGRMARLGVRRLPVVDRENRMVGFVTLSAASQSRAAQRQAY